MDAYHDPGPEKWAVAFQLVDEIEANLIARQLTDAGIAARVHMNITRVLFPIHTWEPGVVDVMVPESSLPAAREAMRQFHNSPDYQVRARGWQIIEGGQDDGGREDDHD